MDVQTLRAEAFKALHERPGTFVIPNPWDAGSAKLLASLGFEALATSSAGLAFALGRPDAEGAVSRDETLANAQSIVDATALPVAADLENGYSEEPSGCAETILQAAKIGLVGGSIEDATGRADAPIYNFHRAVERVEAAVAAVRAAAAAHRSSSLRPPCRRLAGQVVGRPNFAVVVATGIQTRQLDRLRANQGFLDATQFLFLMQGGEDSRIGHPSPRK